MLNEFLEVVLDVKGNLASRRLTEKFFVGVGKQETWKWFSDASDKFEGYDNRSLVLLLREGRTKPPTCQVCGNNAKVQFYATGGKISDWCSLECANKDTNRAKKISETKLAWSEEKKAEVKEKLETTLLKNHGRKTISFKGKIPHNRKQLPSEEIQYSYVELKKSLVHLAEEFGCDYDTIRTRLTEAGTRIRRTSNYSREEVQIAEFLESNGVEVESGNWSVLGDKELDLFIPTHRLAIELNGLHWHSTINSTNEARMRHVSKSQKCSEQGIELWHITDEQWHTKKDILKSMLLNKIGLASTKVYARKCLLKEVSSKEAKVFFNDNHIQGQAAASIYYGLYYNEDMVMCLSFGKARYNSNYVYELIRSATKKGFSVAGGFSRILKHFQKNHEGSLVSYADRSYSTGKVYEKNGFKLASVSEPGYFWTKSGKSYNRVKFQKHKLAGLLKDFDSNLSESENMYRNGYKKYWDCGQLVYVLSK